VSCLTLTLLVGWQEGHPACKKWGDGGGGHWMEWHRAGWLVCLPLLIFPSGTGSPGWSRKKGRKTVVVELSEHDADSDGSLKSPAKKKAVLSNYETSTPKCGESSNHGVEAIIAVNSTKGRGVSG